MVHKVPSTLTIAKTSRKAYGSIGTNALGVKMKCLNLFTRCNLSPREVNLNTWLIETNQSGKGDEHVHAHKPHSCPDQMEILEEKYSDVADLSGVMQRIAVSDVRHCPEAPKIQGLECSATESSTLMSEYNHHLEAYSEAAGCSSSNGSIHDELWGFSCMSEDEDKACIIQLDRTASLAASVPAECEEVNHNPEFLNRRSAIFKPTYVRKLSGPEVNFANLTRLSQSTKPSPKSDNDTSKSGVSASAVRSSVATYGSTKRRPMARRSQPFTDEQTSSARTQVCSTSELFFTPSLSINHSCTSMPYPAPTSSRHTGAQGAALSALDSCKVKKPVSWMTRPYRPHKDSTSIWMSKPIGGKSKHPLPKRGRGRPPKQKCNRKTYESKIYPVNVHEDLLSRELNWCHRGLLSAGQVIESDASGEIHSTEEENFRAKTFSRKSKSSTRKHKKQGSNGKHGNTNTTTKRSSDERFMNASAEAMTNLVITDTPQLTRPKKGRPSKKRKPVTLERPIQFSSTEPSEISGASRKKKRSPRTAHLADSQTPKKNKELSNLQCGLNTVSPAAKLSTTFERKSKLEAMESIRCQMESVVYDLECETPRKSVYNGSYVEEDLNVLYPESFNKVSFDQNGISDLVWNENFNQLSVQHTGVGNSSNIIYCHSFTEGKDDGLFGTGISKSSMSGSGDSSKQSVVPKKGITPQQAKLFKLRLAERWQRSIGSASYISDCSVAPTIPQNCRENLAALDGAINRNNNNQWSQSNSIHSPMSSSVSLSTAGVCSSCSLSSSDDEISALFKVKSQLSSAVAASPMNKRIPDAIVGYTGGKQYKFQPVIDGVIGPHSPILESRGYLKYDSLMMPYVVINGFKYIQIIEAAKLFTRCDKRCSIPRRVLLQKHWMISYLTFEQVNQLDMVRGENNVSANTGDPMVRAAALMEKLESVEREIGAAHGKRRNTKLMCAYKTVPL